MRNVGLKNIFEFLRLGRVGARIGGVAVTVYDNFLVDDGAGGTESFVDSSGQTFRVRQ
tara:strand:- start:3254 stop:3427 length:174 start_codon:yes stop_codon:yes gene_type:complete